MVGSRHHRSPVKSETRVIANALLSFLARGVTAVVGFLMVPFLITSLGQAAYGMIGIIGSILGFVVLIELGIRPAAGRQFARFLFAGEIHRSNELASTAMAAYMVLAAVILVVMGFAARTFLKAFDSPAHLLSDGTAALIIASLSLGAALVTTPYRAALTSQLRHDIEHYTDIVNTILRASLIVLSFSLWKPQLCIWASATFFSSVVVLLITRWQSHIQCPSVKLSRNLISRAGFKDLAGFGAYTSVAQLSAWLNLQSGPLIIGYFLGTPAVAHYTPVIVLATTLRSLSSSFLLQLQPVVTQASLESDFSLIRRVLFRSTRYSLLLSGGAAVWVGCLSFSIVPCWLGNGFSDTSLVLVLWCSAIFFQACVGGAFSVFLGTGKLRMIAALNAVLAVVSVVGALVFVGIAGFGVAGVAFWVLVTQMVRTAGWIIRAARIANIRGLDYLRESYAGPLTCITCLMALSLGLQHLVAAGPWIELFAAGIPSLIAFAGLAWTIGLNEQDRMKALDYLREGRSQFRQLMARD
jgi:O-antigen/teichoic acid export membrane protein